MDAHAYDLHFVLDGKRFFWRNPNRGVALVDDGRQSRLAWSGEDGDGSRLWTEIVAVSLSAATDGKAAINQCRIAFRDGRSILVSDTNERGQCDDAKTPVYRDFVRALHARLARAPEGTIAFTAGVSEARHRVMMILMGIAAAFFVGLPVVLLFIVRDWRVLLTLAAGAAFVWPMWRIAERNRPRRYDPRHPPGELME